MLVLDVFGMLPCFGVSWYSAFLEESLTLLPLFTFLFVVLSRGFLMPPLPRRGVGFSFVFARVVFAFWHCNPTDLYNPHPPFPHYRGVPATIVFLMVLLFLLFLEVV